MMFIDQLKSYVPYNEQERKDKELILFRLEKEKNIFSRESLLFHMTASAWIVNPPMTKTLFCFHKIYQSWSWLGGHADGEEDLLKVALKEANEESGLKEVHPFDGRIFSVECLPVSGHFKKGNYVPSHLHLNATYLLIADEKEDLHINEKENSGLAWFTFKEALENSNEPWLVENIYKKLVEKTESIKKAHFIQ